MKRNEASQRENGNWGSTDKGPSEQRLEVWEQIIWVTEGRVFGAEGTVWQRHCGSTSLNFSINTRWPVRLK